MLKSTWILKTNDHDQIEIFMDGKKRGTVAPQLFYPFGMPEGGNSIWDAIQANGDVWVSVAAKLAKDRWPADFGPCSPVGLRVDERGWPLASHEQPKVDWSKVAVIDKIEFVPGPPFKVLLKKQVIGMEPAESQTAYKLLTMPFVPYDGIAINDGTEEIKLFCITWNMPANRFDAFTESDIAGRTESATVEERLQYWIGRGWGTLEAAGNV